MTSPNYILIYFITLVNSQSFKRLRYLRETDYPGNYCGRNKLKCNTNVLKLHTVYGVTNLFLSKYNRRMTQCTYFSGVGHKEFNGRPLVSSTKLTYR